MPEFIVTDQEAGLALEGFLQRRIPAAPASYLKQLLKRGKVRNAAGPLLPTTIVQLGDRLQLPDSARLLELLNSPLCPARRVEILYESQQLLVVNKPAGVAVHASQGHEQDNLTASVTACLAERGLRFQLAPIHRLDLETSGPVLFGKGKQACGELGKLFMRQQIGKCYLALVQGKTAGQGQLESLLRAKGKVKPASTDFLALARNDQASLLELRPHTGRQHQIRRQLAELGHPLFGDARYRGPCPPELSRLFLHCQRLEFVDPFSAAPITIESPLPAELAAFLSLLDLSSNSFLSLAAEAAAGNSRPSAESDLQ